MAYTHSKVEVLMPINIFATAVTATGQADHDLTTATTIALSRWAPGMVPHIVRGVAVVATVAGASDITVGKVIFQHEKPVVEIKPGQGVRAQMETVATTGIRGHLVLYLEPRWETPANLPMVRTT